MDHPEIITYNIMITAPLSWAVTVQNLNLLCVYSKERGGVGNDVELDMIRSQKDYRSKSIVNQVTSNCTMYW